MNYASNNNTKTRIIDQYISGRKPVNSGNPVLVILPVLICVIPASALIYQGSMQMAGNWFWTAIAFCSFFFITQQIISRRPHLMFVTLIVGTSPLINYLRSYGAPYNIVTVVFFAAMVNFLILKPALVRKIILKNKLLLFLFIFELVYFGLAFFNTRSYSIHLRAFEMIFAAQVIYILLITHPYLAKLSILGILLTSLALAVGFIPYLSSFGRLGIGIIEDSQIGNPITLGLPLALGFLALIVDKGSWLSLKNHSLWRYLLLIPTTLFLAMSGSRASWVIALVGVITALLTGKKQKWSLLIGITIVIIISGIFFNSPQGIMVTQWLDRTVSSDLPLYKRTSGRSDQWIVGWYAFKHSYNSIVGGYGAGLGPEIYANFSQQVQGIHSFVGGSMAWHALILQIGIELGLLGLIPFVTWLGIVCVRSLKTLKYRHHVFPITCLIGYIVTISTVSGYASIPGIFLGVAIWGIYYTKRQDYQISI